jgi:acyl-coenzyme A synthetase/AMP-(fatty) acid ligase
MNPQVSNVRRRSGLNRGPSQVQVWDDLPRNSMGKIQRFIIRDRVAADPA